MMHNLTRFLVLFLIFGAFVYFQIENSSVAGNGVKIKDGDSFYLENDEIRLWGIDAPELFQKCQSASGTPYPCGRISKEFLQKLTQNENVQCETMSRAKRETRKVAKCFINGQDIAQILLSQGMVVEYDYFSKNFYDKYEQIAKNSKIGIWAGSFDNPRDWRKKHKSSARIPAYSD